MPGFGISTGPDNFDDVLRNLSNSQCTVNGLGTSVAGSGPTLVLTLPVTASPTFLGPRNIYVVAEDSETSTSGWQIRGTWTPQ